jgi:lipoprotein-anchoring transpeptidase ErfK/SrfK
VQNFSGPYALHTAYWHDDWGDGASGGCVNLSPLDARYLFDFTEPRVPPGWHAVRREAGGPTTRVVLHL